jgi:hypothetical protein
MKDGRKSSWLCGPSYSPQFVADVRLSLSDIPGPSGHVRFASGNGPRSDEKDGAIALRQHEAPIPSGFTLAPISAIMGHARIKRLPRLCRGPTQESQESCQSARRRAE